MSEPLLVVTDLAVGFRSDRTVKTAVRRVNFQVGAGEVVGIVGESGSGKSVTCHSIMGLLPPQGFVQGGSVRFEGSDLLTDGAQRLYALRGSELAMIFQDPQSSLNPCLKIITQLTEHLRYHRRCSMTQARKQAAEVLSEVGIPDPLTALQRYPHEFSGGQRQRLMIATALITGPRLIIADEPTTALDVTVQAQILTLLKALCRQRHLAMIFVSHDLSVIAQIADRIMVMKDGEVVERGTSERLFSEPQHRYTRRLIEAIPAPQTHKAQISEQPLLQVSALSLSWRGPGGSRHLAVKDADLTVHNGEILGLVGQSGCGKSTLARSLVGLLAPDSGTISLEGRAYHHLRGRALQPLRRRLQMIFQDPYASLNPRLKIYDILAEPLWFHRIVRSRSELSEQIESMLAEVDLPVSATSRYPHQFSGGQRQRIAIARALATSPQLLIADEPTSSLDVTVQQKIIALLKSLVQRRGLSLLFISHDLRLIHSLCDRVAVMNEGQLLETGTAEQIFASPQQPFTRQLIASIPDIRLVDTRS